MNDTISSKLYPDIIKYTYILAKFDPALILANINSLALSVAADNN
jgi:hypothetical protein